MHLTRHTAQQNTLQPLLHWQHHITATSKQITWWAGAAEVVHKVMTCGPILARIWLAVIHIQLTVLSLEALGAVARIWANQILARSTILTRCWLTLIDLILAVTASVAILTVTAVAIAYVLACSVVAQIIPGHTCTNQTIKHRSGCTQQYQQYCRAVPYLCVLLRHCKTPSPRHTPCLSSLVHTHTCTCYLSACRVPGSCMAQCCTSPHTSHIACPCSRMDSDTCSAWSGHDT